MFHLIIGVIVVLAINQERSSSSKFFTPVQHSSSRLLLLKGAFSRKRASRQSPLLSGLHRGIDGALIGALVAVAFMSALTLHWQYLWTVSFSRLERSRLLSNRLMDSTAILERHFLQNKLRPKSFVLTKTSDLVYIDHPFSKHDFGKVKKRELIGFTVNRANPRIYGY